MEGDDAMQKENFDATCWSSTRWSPRHPYLCDGHLSVGARNPNTGDALFVRVN